jgi:hypothetical protein
MLPSFGIIKPVLYMTENNKCNRFLNFFHNVIGLKFFMQN